ncbi:hypothetical protein [Geomonas edaphica]|uniref:hypothetical protein n=1 Tax=Geomonas edaphica TaxID=2570226 RepID=UPI0010A8FC25|nr:hypothetical protein [Geomonas edaphica]
MMKRVGLLVVGALLGGCVHQAPVDMKSEVAPATAPALKKVELSEASIAELIVKDKTTKEQVLAAYGSPVAVEPNKRQLSKEMLATIKVPMPPIARTKEFWTYNAPPFNSDGSMKSKILSAMFFMDDNGVVVDYLTSYTHVAPPQ